MVELKDVSVTYSSGVDALHNVNLKINDGDFAFVVGASGAGKSTMIKLILKEINPTSGSIYVNGYNLNKLRRRRIPALRRTIGFVFQDFRLIPSMTVYENVAFVLRVIDAPTKYIRKRVPYVIGLVGLQDKTNAYPDELSGGEKASVAIASAIISDVQVLLLDEPLSQLDPKAVTTVSSMLKRINEELGVTVIVVSHSSEEFIDFCDRLVILENGEIICNDTPYNAKNNASLLPYFPVCTRLFDERPLNIKSAVSLADKLKEKPLENKNENKSEVCVNLKNITFAYNKNQRDILSCLDFKAYKAQINCIIGANGSGKTTLLKVIAGIKKQYFGKSKILGKCSYMPQNVKYLFTKDLVSEEIDAQTAEKLSIADCLNQHPFDLSGGQAQKLAFGILLEQDADILLLDEPTKAFDEFSKNDLKSLLFELKAQGKTIIMVSHDLDFVGDIADNVSFLSDGIISKAGGRREVLSSLNFYTTQIRRITKRYLAFAVSMGDIL